MKDLHYHDYDQVYGMPLTELYLMTEAHDKENLFDLFFHVMSKALERNDILRTKQARNCMGFVRDRIKE